MEIPASRDRAILRRLIRSKQLTQDMKCLQEFPTLLNYPPWKEAYSIGPKLP